MQFFCTILQIFNECLNLKYIVSYTIIRLPSLKKHDPKVIQEKFDNKKDGHILCKYNKEKIFKIHHWSPEIFKFL